MVCVTKLCVKDGDKVVSVRLCVTKLCVTKLYVKDGVCVTKLGVTKLVCDKCVTKLCVKDGMRAGGTQGRKDGRADEIQKQKQEAHTKMWGKSYLRETDSLAAWMSPNATLARQNEG